MRTRSTLLLRLGFVGLSSLVFAASPKSAHAEADTFGLGDGHSGVPTIGANTIINAYAGITQDVAAGASTISISNTIGTGSFATGDLVLVWRTTGVAAAEAPSGNQTKRVNLATANATTTGGAAVGLAGTYEFARVQTAAAGSITLSKPLVRSYTRFVSQVVRVPEYTTVTINAGSSILPAAWQEIGGTPAAPNPDAPWAGGIVIFMATGTITNNGVIHANGRGFHGGLPVQRPLALNLACDNNALDGNSSTGSFSPKGQGVVHSLYTAASGGKGNISMAGGGGNCTESGGGGGANLGNGGRGSGTALNLGSGGLGGVGIDYDVLAHLTMGGGGGSGRHNIGIGLLNSEVSFGGFGGGVVYIRGGSMAGTGKVEATGGNGEDSGLANLPAGVASQGSGGGGAGGTIVVRLAGALDCDSLASAGGNGGSAQVAGIPVFGAGGGGGGGRVFFQSTSKTAGCDVIVTPGTPGNNGQGGSQGGSPGGTQPANPFCFDNTPGQCADPISVCDIPSGECKKCSGPFGGGTPLACPVNVEPVCLTDGSCVPCDGDFNSGTAKACQLLASPHCFVGPGGAGPQGSCGKCTTNADCTGPGHSGPICNVLAGVCGTGCTTDADCKPTEWCAAQDASGGKVCIPKTPNKEPVTSIPPFSGDCTIAAGQRTCLSGVCEEIDDRCGFKNSTPCTASTQCRSSICFDKDDLCGKPNGEPCGVNEECRSDKCVNGVCTGCQEDTDCVSGKVCDTTIPGGQCVDGCRPGAVAAPDAGPEQSRGLCPPGMICVVLDGGAIGVCQPDGDGGADGGGAADGGDTSGIIEGGGCACNTTTATVASPFAISAAALGILAIARRVRRKDRSSNSRSKAPNGDAP